MKTISLFSGIGGLDLGLERAGFEIVAQCERDPYCREILARHWPGVPCWDDVSEMTFEALDAFAECAGIEAFDCVCGGFPCQDISTAGKGAGLDGERSGLWWRMFDVVVDIRPRWVIAENVPALRTRGADRVLGALEGIGYACTPIVVGAVHTGAPHRRLRVFIVAHDASDAEQPRLEGHRLDPGESEVSQPRNGGWWKTEPDVGRVAHGVPRRVDRLRALGNAVVPQVAEAIGRAVMAVERGAA